MREQDFVALSDVTDFILAAVAAECMPPVLNVVSSRHVSMRELAELVVETIGKGNIKILGQNKTDPLEGEFARYSSQLASESLGWAPKKTLRSSITEIGEHVEKGH
jgi:nucleoside-diphosphate-sugar epimerase